MVDPKPNSPNQHHRNCTTDVKENYQRRGYMAEVCLLRNVEDYL